MRFKISPAIVLATALWGSVIFAPQLSAQSSKVTVAQTDQLTVDSLKTMLDGLGYEPKTLGSGWLVSVKSGTWTLNVGISISKDGTKMGLNANLGSIAKPEDVTAKQWQDMLIENGVIDPSCFYFDKDQKKLYMHRSLDNRALTPVYLRKQIDAFCQNIIDTEPYWKFTQ